MIRTERFRRLSKEGVWIVLGQMLAVVGSLIGVRLLTQLLTPDAYGELALGMTVVTLINQIIFGPLGGGISRFYAPALECDDLSGLLRAAKKMMLNATWLVLTLGIIVILSMWAMKELRWSIFALSALGFAILYGYSSTLSGIQTAARQRAIVALHQGADPLLRALIASSLLVWFAATSTTAMAGYVLAFALVLGSQIYFLLKHTQLLPSVHCEENKWQKKIWKFSWPIGLWGVFAWLQLSSDRWALQVFSSSNEVGNYAVLYQLGFVPISLLTGMAVQFLLPIMYQRAGDASDQVRNANANTLSWRLAGLSLILTLLLFLVAAVLHPLIFRVLVAEEFRANSYLFPCVILSGGLFATGQTFTSNFLSQMKTKSLIAVKITTGLLGLVLNVVGAYWYGIKGVVYAGLVFSIVYLLWMTLLVHYEHNKANKLNL
jgi:O-antigen/teichoic acid export membrane protein